MVRQRTRRQINAPFLLKTSTSVNLFPSPLRLTLEKARLVTAPESKAPPKAAAIKPRAKDAAALEEAFAQYQAELLGTLFYLVGNMEDARDALQEAFVKCWRSHEKLVEVQNLKAWIFRIAL